MSEKKQPDPRFVFLDLETSGLEPELDEILEIGVIISDPQLEKVSQLAITVAPTEMGLARIEANEFVKSMHTVNGLLEDIKTKGIRLDVAEDAMLDFLINVCKFEPKTATMGGYSIHFDRAFLKRHMPRLEAFFDYRQVDTSSFRGLARRQIADIDARWKAHKGNAETAHRVIADCEEALAETRLYNKAMNWPALEDYMAPRERLEVSPEAFQKMLELIDAPVDPNSLLHEAARRNREEGS